MSPEQLNGERPPHTGNMGEPESAYQIAPEQTPEHIPDIDAPPREPAYTVKPNWELLWGAIVAIVAAVALAVAAMSDGDIRNVSVIGGVVAVAAVRGLAGWVIQTMTRPRDDA